jgi:hypothetical protein
MRGRRPQIQIYCDSCGSLARLKTIQDYPFSKGFSEVTYQCSCGHAIKRVMPAVTYTQQESPRAAS